MSVEEKMLDVEMMLIRAAIHIPSQVEGKVERWLEQTKAAVLDLALEVHDEACGFCRLEHLRAICAERARLAAMGPEAKGEDDESST